MLKKKPSSLIRDGCYEYFKFYQIWFTYLPLKWFADDNDDHNNRSDEYVKKRVHQFFMIFLN